MRAKSALALRGLAFLLILSTTIPAAIWSQTQPSPYGFQQINVFGAPVVLGYGVNNSGTVAGVYNLNPQVFDPDHGFTLSGSQPNSIDIAGADSSGTDVFGINDLGDVVGSFNQQGFLLTSGGQFTTISFPNSFFTIAAAVNNLRQVVGWYQDRSGTHGFLWQNGQFAGIAPVPGGGNFVFNGINNNGRIVGSTSTSGFLLIGANYSFINLGTFTSANGINDSDIITGFFLDSANATHGFVLTGGSTGHVTTLDAIGVAGLEPNSINNAGVIVGSYPDQSGNLKFGFKATPVLLLDPVPDALSGPSVTTNGRTILDNGIPVQGIAADGVAQIVVAIPAQSVGDQFTLTLLNDGNTQSSSSDEDGGLARLGGANFTQNNVTVSANAVSGQQTPFAFALYRAPVDFARLTSNGFKQGSCSVPGQSGSTAPSAFDNEIGCRTVFLQVQNLSTGSSQTIPIEVVRPPVVLIHGLWGKPADWNNFAPLYSNFSTSFGGSGGPLPDSRFHIKVANYDKPVTILASSPSYSFLRDQGMRVLANAHENSLGFQYNTVRVLRDIHASIDDLKGGQNPAGIAVAAIQADLVGHSMGGDISRTLPFENTFLGGTAITTGQGFFSDSTFNQGYIHKLITIDTPHLGSTLATKLFRGENVCVAGAFAMAHLPAFTTVVVAGVGVPVNGAVGDLVDFPQSQALQNIASPGQRGIATAMVSGTINSTNLAGLTPNTIGFKLGLGCRSSPLAASLLSGWPNVFDNEPNHSSDAIVGLTSQLNGLPADQGLQFDGYVHGPGVIDLGFKGPSVLDAGAVPTIVITLLNAPRSNPVFHLLNP